MNQRQQLHWYTSELICWTVINYLPVEYIRNYRSSIGAMILESRSNVNHHILILSAPYYAIIIAKTQYTCIMYYILTLAILYHPVNLSKLPLPIIVEHELSQIISIAIILIVFCMVAWSNHRHLMPVHGIAPEEMLHILRFLLLRQIRPLQQ